jgi:hypothetical protein
VDTEQVSKLLETLIAELERPRELSARVVNYIGGTYGIDDDAVGSFLVNELPGLEDYEVDLILSPVFTPKLADQAIFAEVLGRNSLPRSQWPALIQQLISRPTRAELVVARPYRVPLREVTIERYVHRLRLEGTISEPLAELLDRMPSTERPILLAVARRVVWESDARSDILFRYLAAKGGDTHRLEDAVALLDLVESDKPAHVADLLARIPRRKRVLESEINSASGPKVFFSGRVQELHGGERDQRRQDDARLTARESELAFLERLQQALTT